MNRKFQRTVESFTCEHCGKSVDGNGYTNHCPECLWSKHVDQNPGDRSESCLGLMEPIEVRSKGNEHILTHQCHKCGTTRKIKSSKQDNFESLLKVARGERM